MGASWWREVKMGMMCSNLLVLVNILAVAVWITWILFNNCLSVWQKVHCSNLVYQSCWDKKRLTSDVFLRVMRDDLGDIYILERVALLEVKLGSKSGTSKPWDLVKESLSCSQLNVFGHPNFNISNTINEVIHWTEVVGQNRHVWHQHMSDIILLNDGPNWQIKL